MTAALAALAAGLLYVGGAAVWASLPLLPWPGRAAGGGGELGGLAGLAAGGILLVPGLVVTALGVGCAALAWVAAGLPRPRWRRRRAPAA